jgi:hypothetical protein
MSINVATEFTRSGSFAIWESGSFNPQTDNGWACLVADPNGLPQNPVFERNVLKSKHHYLFRVTLGSLVVITNIQRMPNSKDLFSARVTLGRVTSLQTRPNDKNPTRLDAVSEVQPLWSESYLSPYRSLQECSEDLMVVSPGLTEEVLNQVHQMIWASVDKALTPATAQRMFWGEVREVKPKKMSARSETLMTAVSDELEAVYTTETGRTSSRAQQAALLDPATDTTAGTVLGSGVATLKVPNSETVEAMLEARAMAADRQESEVPAECKTDEHDGTIQADSMSLCGLSSDPLSPMQTN